MRDLLFQDRHPLRRALPVPGEPHEVDAARERPAAAEYPAPPWLAIWLAAPGSKAPDEAR